jgi:hypothetical protein
MRLVITNGGPATMENVTVKVLNGDNMSLAPDDVTALWPKMPVKYLHVGQSLALTLSPSLGTRDPGAAVVKWSDRRDDEQSRRFDLSYNRVMHSA